MFRVPRRRSSGVALVVAVMAIFAVAAGAIAMLRGQVSELQQARLAAAALERATVELNVLEWQAIAKHRVTPEVRIGLGYARGEIRRQLERVLRFVPKNTEGGARVRATVHDQLDAYEAGVDAELAMLPHSVVRAREIDEERTDPAYDRLLLTVETACVEVARAQRLRDRWADRGSVAILAAALTLAGLLAWRAAQQGRRADVSAARERALRESEGHFRALVQNASDAVLVVNAGGDVTAAFGAIQTTIGATSGDILGANLCTEVHPDDRPLVTMMLNDTAQAAERTATATVRIPHSEGAWRYVDVIAANLLDEPGVRGIVLTVRDVSDRKAIEEQLRHRAFHDPLTHLANRALFYDRVEHAVARERHEGELVALLFIDLDDFKLVNDRYGHATGDEVIVAVANRLRCGLRAGDTAARLGGDEFGILIERVGGVNEPVQAALQLLASFREPFAVHGAPIAITPSIGISLSDESGTAEDMLRNADIAMYVAKKQGKGRYELFDAGLAAVALPHIGRSSEDEPDRITWFARSEQQRDEILSLVDRPELIRPSFQPIIDLRTGRIAGFEALSRFSGWDDRPPNAWFAQAHRVGLGPQIEALAMARALSIGGRPPATYLSINVSASALTSPEVQAVLPGRLDDIVIEITENELLAEDPSIRAAIEAARARGARFAIDDAGSGYAGLKQLTRLRPDIVKLDRSIVHNVHANPTAAALIESFVRFASRTDALVCAEGVETVADLVCLAELDVTYAQGFLIARPEDAWPGVRPDVVAVCSASLHDALSDLAGPAVLQSSEARLGRVAALLAAAATRADVRAGLGHATVELNADALSLSSLVDEATFETVIYGGPGGDGLVALVDRPETAAAMAAGQLVQVLVGDPHAEPAVVRLLRRRGYASLLSVPVVAGGTTIGLLEAYRRIEQPWSRLEMHRARLMALQLASYAQRVGSPDERQRLAAAS